MPSTAYVCEAVTPVPVAVLSPQFHTYVIASPLGSVVLVPKKLHARAAHTGALITGIGAAFVGGLATVTSRVAVVKSPHPSVTISVTV